MPKYHESHSQQAVEHRQLPLGSTVAIDDAAARDARFRTSTASAGTLLALKTALADLFGEGRRACRSTGAAIP
jgi:hypothetical protein